MELSPLRIGLGISIIKVVSDLEVCPPWYGARLWRPGECRSFSENSPSKELVSLYILIGSGVPEEPLRQSRWEFAVISYWH